MLSSVRVKHVRLCSGCAFVLSQNHCNRISAMYEFSWKSCLWPSTTRVTQRFCQQNILPSPRFAQLLIRENGSLWIRPMHFKSGVLYVKVAFRGFRVFQKNINTLLRTAHIVTDLYLISVWSIKMFFSKPYRTLTKPHFFLIALMG